MTRTPPLLSSSGRVLAAALLCLPALAARWWLAADATEAWATPLSTLEIYAISLLVLHWTVVFTVGIGAFIVMVMKGPAYVADAYALDEAENPADFRVDRSAH